MDYKAEAQALQQQLVHWRRDLHMHPELGFEEERTAGLVTEHLRKLGYRIYTGVATTGVIGLLQGARPGPTVMLRFDMDALPIQEENEVAYASQTSGVMHACGHDAHVTIGMGTAMLLERHRDEWGGTVKLVFQPGEEGMNGAEVMVEAGALDDYGPRPDVAFGLHVWNPSSLGRAHVTPGPIMAAADRWTIKITGRGGHGAMPHQTIDPVVAAGQLITALQTIVSRNVDPQKTAVVTVGTVKGGTAFNIIPGHVELTGTIRTFEAEVRETVIQRMQALCDGIGAAMGVEVALQITVLTPALVNDPAATAFMRRAGAAVLGEANVDTDFRTMGSEDMAYFLREVPGSFMFLGSANAERGLNYPHHSPRFDVDEGVLPLGVAILTQAATDFLNREATD
jgi:amidohydrolase